METVIGMVTTVVKGNANFFYSSCPETKLIKEYF